MTIESADQSSEVTRQTKPEKSSAALVAEHMTSAATTAAITSSCFIKGSVTDLPLGELVIALEDKVARVQKGDVSDLEATLAAQATALNSIFSEMARRAAANMGIDIDSCECYLKLALKAQGQCRATIETLASMKNPPVVIARQANFAAGHQQVNNGESVHPPSENCQNPQNKLLDSNHGQRLDIRTTSPAVSADTHMAPVGKRNRPTNGRGKGARVSKCGEGEDS